MIIDAPNPMERTYPDPPAPVSKHRYLLSGIWANVYGLDELKDGSEVSCLWLFHPRLQAQENMEKIDNAVLGGLLSRSSSSVTGLIAVSFDQRNHGTRKLSGLTNGTWREGNETHAQDMFSIYRCST